MQIIKMRGSGTTFRSNSAAGDGEPKDPGHALAEMINDMVFLSRKIDSFCFWFESARRKSPETPAQSPPPQERS